MCVCVGTGFAAALQLLVFWRSVSLLVPLPSRPRQPSGVGSLSRRLQPVSPLVTQVWSTGTTHLCLTALRDRAVLAQRSPDYLDRSSRFPKHLKVQGNPPRRSPSHSPGGEGEATVCPPPRKGTGDVGTQPPANPLSPGKPSDLSFRGWKWGGASADRWSFTFSELDLHGVSAPHMERGLLSL